jgi:formylglycine-generating enzyme required for sulfatase activity
MLDGGILGNAMALREERTVDRWAVQPRRAIVAVLAVVLALAAAFLAWLNWDLLREQYQWRVVMGPSVLAPEQERAYRPGDQIKECAAGCPTLIVIPRGQFLMGSPPSEQDRQDNESPRRRVTIAEPFAVGKFDVTFAEWDRCTAADACPVAADSGWGRGDRPAINVSFDDAKLYVAWLSRLTGKGYRLLSEAEWEYVARAGGEGAYSFGDDERDLDGYARFSHLLGVD